mgnify:CR=1 FL=1
MRIILCLFVVLYGLFSAPAIADTGVAERLLINAEITARKMLNNENFSDARDILRRSRAVIIIPSYYRGGFMLGAAGGTGVILAKDNSGIWGYPGFVNLGSLTAGLQIGFSGAEMLVFVITNEGLSAIINNQVRIGGNAGLAVATFGGDVGGAKGLTTDADYIIYAKSAGLYAGLSLEGAVIEAQIGRAHV